MKLFQQGRTWYWYILMISLCYLIAPYVFQIIDRAADDITAQMRVITLFSFVTLLALVMQTYYAALFSHVNIALLRFPSFFVGSYFGRVAWQKKRVHPGVFLLGAVFVFLLPLRFNGNIIMTRFCSCSRWRCWNTALFPNASKSLSGCWNGLGVIRWNCT